ncbi:MAG TPA: 3-deoxy-7-phosphoheptulonate synthase [Ktedonobacterales bacterium]
MVVVVREGASPEERDEIARILASRAGGYIPTPIHTSQGEVFCLPRGAATPEAEAQLQSLAGVERVLPLATAYQLASRAFQPEKTVVQVGEARIGGDEPVVIAGPCSVESEEQILEAARAARAAGAQVLRGGAFKPRTSPYAFQGLGLRGVELLAQAGAAAGLPIVTEVMEPGFVAEVAALSDILQVGSRNMQNYPLLRAVGRSGRPVLLKRGFASTVEEWLLAAEYILAEGNPNVILCERGVRSYDPQTRNLLDLTCVPLLSGLTHLPVIVDPSHATGKRELVLPMGIAAIAAGADGLIVEMHPRPDEALSDAAQTIDPATLRQLVRRSHVVHAALLADVAEHASEGELVGSETSG